MELNEQHIEILSEVREKLRARLKESSPDQSDGSEYICVQVLRAIGRRHGIEKATFTSHLPVQAQFLFQEFSGAITHALDNSTSVGVYINRLKLKVVGMESTFTKLGPLARLAWLDRMIETKVLA